MFTNKKMLKRLPYYSFLEHKAGLGPSGVSSWETQSAGKLQRSRGWIIGVWELNSFCGRYHGWLLSLQESQRQREMVELRYARYTEIVGDLQHQLEESKRRIQEYRVCNSADDVGLAIIVHFLWNYYFNRSKISQFLLFLTIL